ncbi:hypothetical protein N7532_006460 [Penicillium argentinense]|uniref:LCCL domain-containing protein n=1 Tax=Penicillium argentinense TaxID=1131581 RepID=A0A9W9FG15_9EURO|nr:uncharacterized protein N7532_006460 [Penicillium argentinense]KAJ5099459.1 hypothetical protein N7532_006460 [Penicillium argentinense]
MQSHVAAGDQGGNSPLLAHPTTSLTAAQETRYTDAEPQRGAREPRFSGDSIGADIELGNVPLLPDDFDQRRDSQDSLSDLDYQQQDLPSTRTRRDPEFDCSSSWLFLQWLRGPVPPHIYHIEPSFPKWQAAPARLVDRWVKPRAAKIALLVAAVVVWIAVFFSLVKASIADQEVLGYGQPVKLSCHARLWSNATDCGLNGDLCRPFDDQSFAFRCPSGCSAAILLEPYNVGAEEYNYRPLVIGGKAFRNNGPMSGHYRGDSSICASALHAGVIDDATGGCGILHRTGLQDKFVNVSKHGIDSIDFQSNFPMSFKVTRQATSSGSSDAKLVECSDIRWSLFAFTLVVTVILSMTVTSAPAFYASMFFIVWFQVAMASDPPTSGYYGLISMGVGRFLPGAFVGFVLYYFCIWRTLKNLDAHIDKTVLWLGGCWVGALNTDTFDRIPISRLTPHDLEQQPGAIPALIIIVGLLVGITFLQAFGFRREGRFFPMLRVYAALVLGVLILVAVPKMNLRIHHYILSLLLIPGTTLQTRPSLLFQGILVGLFINGIARWGFDSILQTPAALLDGGKMGTIPPKVDPPQIPDLNHVVFNFPELPPNVDGLGVIINDVLRYQEFRPKDSHTVPPLDWKREHIAQEEYFRFGYVHTNALGGVWYEDFSEAATWRATGQYVIPGYNYTMSASTDE